MNDIHNEYDCDILSDLLSPQQHQHLETTQQEGIIIVTKYTKDVHVFIFQQYHTHDRITARNMNTTVTNTIIAMKRCRA